VVESAGDPPPEPKLVGVVVNPLYVSNNTPVVPIKYVEVDGPKPPPP
jgi:hypothetical protein